MENVSTTGFKKDQGTIGTFTEMLVCAKNGERGSEKLGFSGFGAALSDSVTSFEQGAVVETDCATDFALAGSGFFVLQGGNERVYTRDGSFTIDNGGYLVGAGGMRVLGERGPVQLTSRNESLQGISVGNDGVITVGDRRADKLLIYDFEDKTQLVKQGENCYRAPGSSGHTVAKDKVMVKQGFLEQSNVDLNTEIVDMMAVLKVYEATQKALHAQDNLSEKALRVGSTR